MKQTQPVGIIIVQKRMNFPDSVWKIEILILNYKTTKNKHCGLCEKTL